METIWLITMVLFNGHGFEWTTMDQQRCRRMEFATAARRPGVINTEYGPLPVASATCRRIEACQDTGAQLALLEASK